ncbi:MAG: hypothetical protein KME12_11640 [Trichocoleus desertorum ATA4-8-CV12]|nr:hypothetical protein [Trichocoleus desertorum ATA4-8-CV12]
MNYFLGPTAEEVLLRSFFFATDVDERSSQYKWDQGRYSWFGLVWAVRSDRS